MAAGTRLSQARRRIAAGVVATMVGAAGVAAAIPLSSQAAGSESGTLSGVVYRDYDSSGARDALEPGEPDIEVRAYDRDGDLVGTATSEADGSYSMSVVNAASLDLRVEFTIPASKPFLRPARAGRTSVEFINLDDDPVVDFGVTNPAEYCQANPRLVTGCFLFGDPVDGSGSGLPHLYEFGSTSTGSSFDGTRTETPQVRTSQASTGATYGLEYNRATRDLYAAAFHKVYAGFGSGGPGAVYRVDVDGGVSVLATIPDAGTDPRAAFAPNTSQNPGRSGGGGGDWLDDPTFDLVGKNSLGDVQLTDDASTLWVVNLNDRQLYPVTTATGAVGTPVAIPRATGAAVSCPADDVRPFGMGKLDDRMYVGMVCASAPHYYLFAFDPVARTFGSAPVFETSLTGFRRGAPGNGCGPNSGRGDWNAWISNDVFQAIQYCAYPQPMAGSIAFDRGNLIIGLRDRFGDQSGEDYPYTVMVNGQPQSRLYEAVAGGDIMRACGSPTTGWTIESAGQCGGSTTAGATNGQGSGGGEYYFQERFATGGNHQEVSLGGVLQLPGNSVVAQTVYDPATANGSDWRSGGIQYYDNATGAAARYYTIFDKCDSSNIARSDGTCDGSKGAFGKASGLSELVALCELAPTQLGNRVWIDSDEDGLQDADEAPVSEVTVRLYDGATLVETAVTNTDGEYLFNDVRPGVTYTVTLDNPADFSTGALAGYRLTQADVNSNGDDAIDSDGVLSGSFPAISHTVAAAGDTNHTLDFGFVPGYSLGNRVWVDGDRSGDLSAGDGAAPGVESVTVEAVRVSDGTVAGTSLTDPDGYYCFSGLPAGEYRVRIPADQFASGAALHNHVTSDGAAQTPGADSGTDNDDDGNDTAVAGAIVSDPVRLGPGGSEPQGEADPAGCATTGDDRGDQTVDFGFYPLASVGNYVWVDANANGVQDDPASNGLNGIRVTLLDGSSNAVTVNGLGQPIFPITTANDGAGNAGYYLFTNLAPGDYRVRFDQLPSGFRPTTTDATSDDLDSDGLLTAVTSLAAGEADLSLDLGVIAPVSVGDLTWIDGDADGIQDPGEQPLAGVTATLQTTAGVPVTADIDGNPITPQVTGSTGQYLFTNLTPGQYRVVFAPPAGWRASPNAQGGDPDRDSTNPATSAVLAPEQVDLTLDAGFWRPGGVGDYTWVDNDRDGFQDGDEDPVSGVTVTLQTGAGAAVVDADGAPVGPMATDASGQYLFTNLRPGSYRVVFSTLPAGFTETLTNAVGVNDAADSDGLTTAPVTIGSGEVNRTLDLGVFAPVRVGNFVWRDSNANGAQDGGEPGIAGVSCTLTTLAGGPVTDAFGASVNPAVTDGNGAYAFVGLLPGQYRVSCAAPAGMQPSPANAAADDVDSDGPVATSAVLTAGQRDDSMDFGFVPLATLGNYAWIDSDRDGTQDDGVALGLNGVRVTLLDSAGDPVSVDGLGNPVFPQLTADDGAGNPGYYLFTNLAPGTYSVRFDQLPAGFSATLTDASGDDSTDSDGVLTAAVTLAPGDVNLTLDFGVSAPTSVGDFTWIDADADGIQDAGEQPLAGVTATLQTAAGAPVTSDVDGNPIGDQITDANGRYLFTNLAPGQYRVVFTPPAGWRPSPPAQGGDPATDSTNPAVSRTLIANEVDLTLDAGFWQPAQVGNYVWVDDDRDGTQDLAEAGVAGVTVTLQRDDGTDATDANGAPVSPVTTDGSGFYLFSNLPPGSYRVVFSNLPAGFSETLTDAAANDQIDSDGLVTAPVTVGSGESNLTLDLGVFAPVAVGNFVWEDLNGNGRQDAGEPGLAGVTCSITRADGSPAIDASGATVTATVTDGAGGYGFADLLPGQYRVSCAAPAGLAPTGANLSDDSSDSDGPVAFSAVLSGGQSDLSIDFGFVRPAALGDRVWRDDNLNGQQDAGEPGVAGVLVSLLDGNGVNGIATTTTGTDGSYSFEGLAAGTYVVRFGLPGSGWVVTSQDRTGDDVDSDADRATGVTSAVTLVPGERNPTIDAGVVPAASIAGTVYHDVSDDGIINPGETAISGVTIVLTGRDVWGNEVRIVGQTGTDGSYVFDNLAPGTYSVRQTQPPEWIDGRDAVGSAGGIGIDDGVSNIDLRAGVRSVGNNFGEYNRVGVGGGSTGGGSTGGGGSDTSDSSLATTGARIALLSGIGLALVGLGAAVRLVGRRRR